MAYVNGCGGNVTFPSGINIAVRSWAANLTVIPANTTEISDCWETADPAHFSFSGVVNGILEYNAASSAPLSSGVPVLTDMKGSFVLTVNTGCTFTFTGVVVSYSFSRDNIEGLASIEFMASGSITVAWDTTP